MGCATCSSGNSTSTPAGCKNNGTCSSGGCNKLEVFDWLGNMEVPNHVTDFNYFEIRFKNSRKEFYKNSNDLSLHIGDLVVVEAKTGYDIGLVSLTGELVKLQMNKKSVIQNDDDFLNILRHASEKDIKKWEKARSFEAATMLKARQLAIELELNMKISDVEYQGDNTKAVFYYTAETRVDFRELIKQLASEFSVKIEMKQIGMRQEASRLGGIGSCGRELCCSTWLTDFRSVSTSAARYQQLSLNPLKLAGQCGKLKCCLNYELDAYLDEIKMFPDTSIKLQTESGPASYQKMDIFSNVMWYSYDDNPSKFIMMRLDEVLRIIDENKSGKKVPSLQKEILINEIEKDEYSNVVGQDSLTRFDGQSKNKNKRRNKKNKNRNHPKFKKKAKE